MRCDSARASPLIVGDIDEGDADVLLQVDQFDLHFFAQLGVQRRQRFVEQQQARPVDQRAGDRHALALAAGKLCRHAPALVRQAYVLQGLFDAGVDLALRHPAIFSGKAMFCATLMCGNSA